MKDKIKLNFYKNVNFFNFEEKVLEFSDFSSDSSTENGFQYNNKIGLKLKSRPSINQSHVPHFYNFPLPLLGIWKMGIKSGGGKHVLLS